MISGAPNEIRCFNLLFLLITLLYKSLRSEVANLPPASCTIGRRSGGRTGRTVIIIAAGWTPAFLIDSINLNLLISLRYFCPFDFSASALSFTISSERSSLLSSSRTPSAPVFIVKKTGISYSKILKYSSSDKTAPTFKFFISLDKAS